MVLIDVARESSVCRNRQADLGADLQRRVHEPIENLVHRSLARVLKSHHAVVGSTLFDHGEDLGVRLARHKYRGAAEPVERRLMAEGGHRPQMGHPRRTLQRATDRISR